MAYSIKEIFYSLQGEGAQAGLETNTRLAIDFCKSNPAWRPSTQTHKLLQIR